MVSCATGGGLPLADAYPKRESVEARAAVAEVAVVPMAAAAVPMEAEAAAVIEAVTLVPDGVSAAAD